MKILIVDDEELCLKASFRQVSNVFNTAEIFTFSDSQEALDSCDNNTYDIAFLDIEMPELNGVELAKKIKAINPSTKILFFTAYKNYAYDAFKVQASGYILKGATSEEIEQELKRLEGEYCFDESKLNVSCFGKFECTYNGNSIQFERSKAKELFAYMIYNEGKSVTLKDIESALFIDADFSDSNLKQIHVFYSSLAKTLKKYGLEKILSKNRNSYSLNNQYISCDYYDYIKGNATAINKFNNDLFSDYSWANHSL